MTLRFASLFGSHGKDVIVAVALLWAALIVAVTGTLHGSAHVNQLLPVLVVAALGSMVIVVVGVRAIHS